MLKKSASNAQGSRLIIVTLQLSNNRHPVDGVLKGLVETLNPKREDRARERTS
jgi:hypothetical protein